MTSDPISPPPEPQAPRREIFDVLPGADGVEIDTGPFIYTRNNLDPFERHVIAVICALRRPRRIVEIGTFDGSTTLLLARSAPDAEVFTLDLPPDAEAVATVEAERRNLTDHGAGRRFSAAPERERITQLFGDSRTFDFSPWHSSVDLVLIDGGHELDVVRADTESAQRLLAPGGVIVWDDYLTYWPGVIEAVDASGLDVIHIARSDLAVFLDPRPPSGERARLSP